MTTIILIGIIFCFVFMALSWMISLQLNLYSIVDPFWAFGIGCLSLVYVTMSNGVVEKKILALCLALPWSLRLGSYLLYRLVVNLPNEDHRYEKLKKSWGPNKFLLFFQLQGLSQTIFSIPIFLIAIDQNESFSILVYIGILVYLVGFLGEGISDYQLDQFRKKVGNKNLICMEGFWKYSRHPNYFFEWLVWMGISISAFGSPYGYIGILSPLLMFFTLNYFTGIPILEARSLEFKGDLYRQYIESTNRFFPRIRL